MDATSCIQLLVDSERPPSRNFLCPRTRGGTWDLSQVPRFGSLDVKFLEDPRRLRVTWDFECLTSSLRVGSSHPLPSTTFRSTGVVWGVVNSGLETPTRVHVRHKFQVSLRGWSVPTLGDSNYVSLRWIIFLCALDLLKEIVLLDGAGCGGHKKLVRMIQST